VLLQGTSAACMLKGSSRVALEESMHHVMAVVDDKKEVVDDRSRQPGLLNLNYVRIAIHLTP
jgi:hypothetical protein